MQEMNYKTILISMSKTKSGKVVVDYVYNDKDIQNPDYMKGLKKGQAWFDDSSIFEKLAEQYFGKVYNGIFKYQPRFDGSLVKSLTNITDESGNTII